MEGKEKRKKNATGSFPLFMRSIYIQQQKERTARSLPSSDVNAHILFPSADGCGWIDTLQELRMPPPPSEE